VVRAGGGGASATRSNMSWISVRQTARFYATSASRAAAALSAAKQKRPQYRHRAGELPKLHHLHDDVEKVQKLLRQSQVYKNPITKVGDGVWQYKDGAK
jgi:hypothetical protein